jgi:phosphoribosylaminoimidazole carboxylase (NCAIR synthetase)
MKIKNQKILILGGNPETAALVKVAKKLGLITYVVDLVNNSPAKKISDFSIDGNATDVNLLRKIVTENNVDGVLVGVADVLVPAYEEICREFNFPCYANIDAISVFTSKDGFFKACKKFNLDLIPNYTDSVLTEVNLDHIEYPVIVKPVDSGGGVGMSISNNYPELKIAVNKAKLNSKVGKFICEKYIKNGQDIQVYYTFVNGEIFLSSIVDRTTNKSQGLISPVCIGASYNSKYIDIFKNNAHQKFIEMFHFYGIKNGVMSIQCFVDQNRIYPYDPGFRLQGEGQHLMLNAINGFDHREMLINFAMTGSIWEGDFSTVNDLYLHGKYACSVWVLLNEGLISTVKGIDVIKRMPAFKDIMLRFDVGDEILPSYIGTEKQVFSRIYIAADNVEGLNNAIEFIHQNLLINDSQGNNMVLDYFRLKF